MAGIFGRKRALIEELRFSLRLDRPKFQTITRNVQSKTRWFMSHEVEILLVDDSAEDVELTVLALRRNKISNDIQIAEDGAEALDFLFCRGPHKDRTFSNPPRLVLLDLKLPKIDGLEVLRA